MPRPNRIVSLLPATTEIVAALGLADRLVGRSHECDRPPSVAALPVLTHPKVDVRAPSAELDAQVKRLVAEGLSVYRVDASALRSTRPDVILTQEQCRVCAATPQDLDEALEAWVGAPVRVVSLEPHTLADVLDDFARVGEALGAGEPGRRLRTREQARIEAIASRAAKLGVRPRVALLEWLDPPMGAGSWLPEIVERAGAIPVLVRPGGPAPWIEDGALAEADPDVILAAPCGFDLGRASEEIDTLLRRPEWSALRAVREGRVFTVDGNLHMNRPGPRIAESVEIVAEILHPESFRFGHEGRGWRRSVG